MRTRSWILLFVIILLVCTVWLFLLRSPKASAGADIYGDGKLLMHLDLSHDGVYQFTTAEGKNTITVQDGKVAVTEASCPDGYCMDRGFCSGGPAIVCLPNHLVIAFTQTAAIDGYVG